MSRIEEHIPNEFGSICHYGILDDGQEVTQGAPVKEWAGSTEKYFFDELNQITTVTAGMEVNQGSIIPMDASFPEALEQL